MVQIGLITEGGIIAFAGIILTFIVKCCQQIEQSRCTRCSCCPCENNKNNKELTIQQVELGLVPQKQGCFCSLWDCTRTPLTKEEMKEHGVEREPETRKKTTIK